MPYLAQRRMRIMGTDYVPGEVVPAESVGVRSLRSLLGRGHLIEVSPPVQPVAEQGSQHKPAKKAS